MGRFEDGVRAGVGSAPGQAIRVRQAQGADHRGHLGIIVEDTHLQGTQRRNTSEPRVNDRKKQGQRVIGRQGGSKRNGLQRTFGVSNPARNVLKLGSEVILATSENGNCFTAHLARLVWSSFPLYAIGSGAKARQCGCDAFCRRGTLLTTPPHGATNLTASIDRRVVAGRGVPCLACWRSGGRGTPAPLGGSSP